jgi:hypothetical protein
MKKNLSGQFIGTELLTTAGASLTTGTTNVFITIDNGTQTTASSTASHKGNGYWSVVLSQAETNGDHVAYTFVNSGAPAVTLQTYPGDTVPALVFSGNPTTAAGTSITLPTTSTTNSQVGNIVGIISGPGFGQYRPITGWTSSTTSRTVTIASAWATPPTTASTLMMFGFGITPINGDSAGNAVVGSFSATATAQIAGTTIALVSQVTTVSNLSASVLVQLAAATVSVVNTVTTVSNLSTTASAQVKAQVTAALASDVYALPTAGLSSSNTIVQYLRLSTHMAMAPRSSSTSTETVMNFTGSAALFTASVTYTTASATATRALFA